MYVKITYKKFSIKSQILQVASVPKKWPPSQKKRFNEFLHPTANRDECLLEEADCIFRGVGRDHLNIRRGIAAEFWGRGYWGLGSLKPIPRGDCRSGSYGHRTMEGLSLQLYDVIIDIFRHRDPNFPNQILLSPILIYIYY